MTEPINQNAISLYCPECNTKIPPEVLEDNNDPNVVCCPSCGVIIPIEPQIEIPEITQEKSEESPQIQVQQPSPRRTAKWHLKLLLYFSIHDLLYSKARVFTKLKKQKHFNSLTIKRYAKQLRSKLLKSPISRHLMTKLTPREQRRLKRAYHLFKESLRDDTQFKKYQIQAIKNGIQFIFDVMRGDYEFVTFSSTEKELIMELKDKVNPFKDMRSKRSLGREFTIIFARIIHQYLFAFSRTNETLTPEVVKELVDGIIDQLRAQDSIEWIESRINIKLNRRERYNFKVIRLCLNIDWIQREYYSDLLVSIVEAVDALMNDMTNEVPIGGLSRILSQGFEESELFRLDKAFSNREKLNISIVLARMIHAHISAAFPPPRQANPNQKLPPALCRDITATILEGLVDHLDINSDFLLRFYNFSLDKFHAAREKLLEKLEGDMIYRASLRTFLTNLIETVFKLTRQEPKESKLTPLELRIREDLELYPYEWRNENVKLFEDDKEIKSVESEQIGLSSGLNLYDNDNSHYLNNSSYLRSVRLFDMIKAVIKSKIDVTQKVISQNLGLSRDRLGEYKAIAKRSLKTSNSGEYYIRADLLDSIEFNILNNPFFSGLYEWQKKSIVRVIDNYRSWIVSLSIKCAESDWRYRVHRPGSSDLDIALRKKMWLFRELRASYTQSGEKIISVEELGIELYGHTNRIIEARFYNKERVGGKADLSIQSFLIALSSVMMSRIIKDRSRALNALYDYGKSIFNFDLKNPNHRLIMILICAFRSEPTISGVFNQDLLSLTRMSDIIASIIQPETFSNRTLTNKIWGDFMFYENSIEKIKLAVEKLISDSNLKSYTIAYLNHYKENFAIERDYKFERNIIIDSNYKNIIKNKALIEYLSMIKGSKGFLETLLSKQDKICGTRISSFNNKMSYVLSEDKGKFISKMLGSKIKAFSPHQAPSSLGFINDLMDFSRNNLYDKKYLLRHGSPAHEIVLPSLVEIKDWAIACEVPVYLKPQDSELVALIGHIDLLVFVDGVLYVCDYKPDQQSKTTPSYSFINSIPQIATYALVLKQMFNLRELKCVTFNKRGVWLYDPLTTLNDITIFIKRNRESTVLPWVPYLREF